MPCPLVWFEAVGQHADKLHSFYGELLGWRFEPARRPEPASRSRRPAPKREPWRRAPAHTEPPWWVSFYSRVADLDAAIETARAHGGRLLVPPTQHGDARIAVVADPEGHPVGLCGE